MMPSGGVQAYCWLVEGLVYIQWKKGEGGKHAVFLSLSSCTAESQLSFSNRKLYPAYCILKYFAGQFQPYVTTSVELIRELCYDCICVSFISQ